MTNVFIDIETIPDEKFKQGFIDDSINNFKAPSSLTKGKAAEDLGLTDANEIKFTSKDAMIEKWEKEMAPKLAEQVGIENFKKCSFDGAKGQICSIAWAVGDGEIKAHTMNSATSEAEILMMFLASLSADLKTGELPYFIGHYVAAFDLKFIFHRLVINKQNPRFKMPFSGRHGSDYYDNMIGWCGFKDKISQDNLCKALGIEGKPDDMDGSKVYQAWLDGEYDKIKAYNIDDVDKCRQVYKRLNYIN